jgi:Tol biopolymer transport system component
MNPPACFTSGLFTALVLALGCEPDSGTIVTSTSEGGLSSTLVPSNYSAWSAPVNLGEVINSSANDQGPGISKDERSLYFASTRAGGFGGNDIWASRRAKKGDPWGLPVNLGPTINTSGVESTPTLSKDEHRLYFASSRPGGEGSVDLWVSERVDKADDLSWQSPVNLGPMINSVAGELGPTFFEDPETGVRVMYFYSTRAGGPGLRDIYRSTVDADGLFTAAVLVPELSTSYEDEQPSIRRDGLEILFASNRPGSLSSSVIDLWVSSRASTSQVWSEPVNLGSVINTAGLEARPSLSFDGTSLYFFSDGHGGFGTTDLFVSTRTKLEEGSDGQ